MLFKDWHDFVVYPMDPERVHTRAARIDTSTACRLGPNGRYPDEYSSNKNAGAVIDQTYVTQFGDAFESMEIDDYGSVMIWTRDNVWCIRRDRGMEKLIFLPRNPPNQPLPTSASDTPAAGAPAAPPSGAADR